MDKSLAVRLARAQLDKQAVADSGGASTDLSWPPSREGWEAFKAQYGRKPFGPQPDGTFIGPPSTDIPDWLYDEIYPGAARRPPIRVMQGSF